MPDTAHIGFDQGFNIQFLQLFAAKQGNSDLFRRATSVSNGCCRGLSMIWLKNGCSASAMATPSDALAAVAQAIPLQLEGEGGAEVRTQLNQLGLSVSGNPGNSSGPNLIRDALNFVSARGRYFISIVGRPNHAIAAHHHDDVSKVFDPNAGELSFNEAEFNTWLKMLLLHYISRGSDTVLIYYLGR